ncbi:MAG: YibE/F family protein [Turicibacter sp.]|nr:YibE/F family protein [Turicibacter sp.]
MKRFLREWWPIAVVLVVCAVMVWVSGLIFEGGYLPNRLNRDVQYYSATVLDVVNEDLGPDNYTKEFTVGVQEIQVKLTDGPYKGEVHTFKNHISRLYNTIVQKNTDIIVGTYIHEGEILDLTVSSYQRHSVLGLLALIFCALVAWIGKLKGIKSLVSLFFTGVCVIYLMLPLLLSGMNPVLAAILIVFLSTFVTLWLVAGLNKKSITAMIGTLAGVLIAALVAYVFSELAHLSGGTMQDTEALLYVSETSHLQVKGLLLAGILVASLGAVMDVAMSIASAMFELSSVNEKLSSKELIRSGMNVGTDMIGTMTNTLILALAGGSLSTVILIYAATISPLQLINLDVLGTELIQGIAGSIGIVITVPVTVLVAAFFCIKRK